ncbi:hypothetical protein BJX63DRAFT_198520 [Aspergillus granulosus]|uniref:Myb-like domain-containing protein n=1 Tax=Aspergillus granulosus TaxID=176169 RepID=A0ABR4GR60_9EURO
MLPTFRMNSFQVLIPPPRKPTPPQKSPNSSSPRTQNPPCPKPCHDPVPSTLLSPKHPLPARPPAEVCLHVSATNRPCTPSNSQIQRREISVPEFEPSLFPGMPERGAASPCDSVPYIPAPDPIRRCDPQGSTRTPTEPPAFRGDYAEHCLLSPSISSLDDSLEEFFRPPYAQDDIPIDPVILADLGPWEDNDPQLHAPQTNSLINLETICPYPDPPAILHNPTSHYRDPSEGDGGDYGGTQASDYDQLATHNRQQAHSSPQGTDPEPSRPIGMNGSHHVSGEPKSSKQKTQQSDGRVRKRPRVHSTKPPREDSFTALRSHFESLPPDDRLQFLSWLFEGALQRCISEPSLAARKEGEVQATGRSSYRHKIRRNPGARRSIQGTSRKGMPWSTEEKALLLRLRKEEKRPWAEVTRVFSKEYPGRSPGAIQVFWSTTLSKGKD